MLNNSNLSINSDDSPIARAYLSILIDLKLTNIKIYNLTNKYFFLEKVNHKINFINKNFNSIKFVKNLSLFKFKEEVENYFGFNNGFIDNMFKVNNFYLFKNSEIIYDRDVNSQVLFKYLSNSNTRFILNTSHKIFKNILDINKDFIHIHPGYLPDVKGADGILNSLMHKNEIGCSAFYMEKKIDQGKIIKRIKYKLPKFRYLNLSNYDNNELYNIWYSFFDPLLRASLLKELFSKQEFEITEQQPNQGKYYSFIDKKKIKEILKKITHENIDNFKN